jgi:hypothetical protein
MRQEGRAQGPPLPLVRKAALRRLIALGALFVSPSLDDEGASSTAVQTKRAALQLLAAGDRHHVALPPPLGQ